MTALDLSQRRGRLLAAAGFVAAAALAWAWLVPVSLDMYGGMDGPSAWMMRAEWDLRYGALIFLMWAVMMVAMMVPGAVPTILRFERAAESGRRAPAPGLRAAAFGGGYLLAWTAFSLAATLLQWGLAELRLLSPMMEAASPRLAAGILIAVGIYQWTPLKRSCLAHCRMPWEPSSEERHLGTALRAGLDHGRACLGCCWALMMLLFAGGVMSLAVIGAITVLVLLEKLTPFGDLIGRLAGIALAVIGGWLLLS